jgi:hypothetical protein
MAWEENSCISLNMQLIAILSRIGVFILHFHLKKAWVLSIYSIIFNKFRHICCDI